MPDRQPVVAGMFYPAQAAACRRQAQEHVRAATPPPFATRVCGGVVPHAGWVYSGPTAGWLYAALQAQEAPETVVLLGAVHRWGVPGAALYGAGQWRTPLGGLRVDEELAQRVLRLSEGRIMERPQAHAEEHSLEVQMPFLAALWPAVRILPIAVPPVADAPEVGRIIAQAVRELGRRAVAVGSSDLTHYGPRYGMTPAGVGERGLRWAKENDRRLLDLVVQLRAPEVLEEARVHHNACGAGAIAATITYAQALGATQGTLLHYTTSYEARPDGRTPSDLVGYGAVALC
jgi:hypothetical protein